MESGCTVHYEHLTPEDPSLTVLTEATYDRIVQARNARIQLGGAYHDHHEKQIHSMPDEFIPGQQYVHRICYQNFTKAISVYLNKGKKAKKVSLKSSPLKRKRRSRESTANLFPNVCMICKSPKPLKVKGKKQFINVIQTFSSCETLKKAAMLRKDEEMLSEICEVDLIAKEFKVHQKCYKAYTLACYKIPAVTEATEERTDTVDESEQSSKTDFEAVCDFVTAHVIGGNQTVSMKTLTEMYGFDKEDNRLRGKVKQRLEKKFGDKIVFLSASYHEVQIVVSKAALTNTTLSSFMKDSKHFILNEAALVLRRDIIEMINHAPDLPWPPTPETLSMEGRQPPESVKTFITNVIHATHHTPGDDVQRYVNSFSQDLVHAVSRGNFLTQKHVLLGTGLHSLTGLKMPVKLLGKFGHCCNYDKVRLIETAQAELAQMLRSQESPLPLLPGNELDRVLTFFWWDNFDVKKENLQGSLHTTHGIAYQEKSPENIHSKVNLSIEKSNRRSVSTTPAQLPQRKIVPHLEPELFDVDPEINVNQLSTESDQLLFLWKLMRIALRTPSQAISRFVGWVIKTLGQPNSLSTTITFLPPIRNPITEYSTVIECITQSQRLASVSNMKYTHVTVDAGAAQKFYHVIWNNPEEFKNVIVHLGDFHAQMEFFGTIGKLVSGSGFEEVVYQAGLCTSGGIKGILSGKHYNRSWMVHEAFSEAIDRLFQEAFIREMCQELTDQVRQDVGDTDVYVVTQNDAFLGHFQHYEEQRRRCLAGEFGKTPQFWLLYQSAVDRQHKLHYSINLNDCDLRLQCWNESLPFCFSMNKQNYARYGAYYCRQLQRLETTHPGAKEEVQKKGLSVCRNTVNIGQSIDGAGEQTFMRSSKTTGGIKDFAHQDCTYEKWVLNRPFQAKVVESLLSYADLDKTSANPRKCLRDREVRKSEERVMQVVDSLKEAFINPFDNGLDKLKLFNLASGKPLPDEICKELTSAEERGKELLGEFNKRLDRDGESTLKFFDPVKRVPWTGFGCVARKTKVSAKGKSKEVAVQRDILGLLMTISYKENSPIDIDKALSFPLAPVPLSLATADGIRRKTAKSKLLDAALISIVTSIDAVEDARCYAIDLIATVRSTVKVPNTFRELAMKLLHEMPRKYGIVYVACDTYREVSIKNAERNLRGEAEQFVIKNPDIRIPANFNAFLANGNNKERLFELIEEVWKSERTALEDRIILFARRNACVKITRQGVEHVEDMATNHEEADTKVCSLFHHALRCNNGEETTCLLRSSSGDIDIPIILLANEDPNLHVYIDNGTGKSRKLLDLAACDLTTIQKQALLGMHAFTGNDYVSSFFRKGKKVCWKIIKDSQEFLDAFCNLGSADNLDENTRAVLEKYVCALYGEKQVSTADDARRKIFWRNFDKDQKVTDLSLLPPCKSSLFKHMQRANYVARMWRQSSRPIMEIDAPTSHGWKEDLSEDWVHEPYPDDVSEILVNKDLDAFQGYDDSSDDEEDV